MLGHTKEIRFLCMKTELSWRSLSILLQMSDSKSFSDKLRFIFIELPAFTNEEEECITDFERWIYVLKNMETLNRLPFKARKAVFEKLEKIIDSHH